MIELKLTNRYITADILKQLDLEPKCLYCENSEPTELMRISCKHGDIKTCGYEENLCNGTCEHFETDFDTFFKGQKVNIKINYRGRSYTYIHDEK